MRVPLITCGGSVAAVLLMSVSVALSARQQPAPPPAPTVDRVGLPDAYRTRFVPLFVFDRPDVRQVRLVYGNHAAASARDGAPYPYGSILVMETYTTRRDDQGQAVRDDAGRFIRDQLSAIFVMRKERGFGVEYAQNRTGEWEYVAFRPDGTHLTPPRESWSCANCHLQATGARDWVFRSNMIREGDASTGAVPDVILQQYSFVPSTLRVRAGTFVTWLNDDEIEHRLAVSAGPAESNTLSTGASFRARFNTPGTYTVQCRIHPNMRSSVVVE